MIYIIRGTSCSGKDTFIQHQWGFDHVVLSSDNIRKILTNDVADQSRNSMVFDYLKHTLELRLMNGCPYTVINATNLKYKDVEDYVNLAEKYGSKATVISIKPPEISELIKRSSERAALGGLNVPTHVIEKHYNTYTTSMPRFIEVAKEGKIKFVEIDQKWNIIQ